MFENQNLKRYIITAAQQVGLYRNQEFSRQQEPDEGLLAEPVNFTLRPVEQYLSHYRGSWTDMSVAPRPVGELGDDDQGIGLILETRFSLAHTDGDCTHDPALVLEEILARLGDFIRSYPVDAAFLFEDPLTWELTVDGEIIYTLEEDHEPILDFAMYPTLGLNILVYEVPSVTAFEQSLAELSDSSSLGQAIRDALQRLALLFRWLDIEAAPTPPLLDLLDNDLF